MNDLAQKQLNILQEEINKLSFPESPRELYDPIKYTLSLGGKRLRPLLVLLGASLFDIHSKNAMKVALAVEVFHNFTLVHDDIMDEAPIRRGKPTVHKEWNRDIAILSGDAMLIKAYELVANCDASILPTILRIFNKTAFEVCEGQQMDMNFETQEDVSVQQYLNMIELKTAVLLGASLQLGALSAGAKDAAAEQLYQFGKYIGIAFQLKDDWLDAYADPDKFGKRVGGDIIAGKKTYLLLKAFELANDTQKELLHKLIFSDDHNLNDDEKVKQVKEIFDALQLSDLLSTEMDAYFEKGLTFLEQVKVNQQSKLGLKNLAEELMTRER